MKMEVFVLFMILLHVSQHALAVVVQAYKGEPFTLLPCQFYEHFSVMPEDPIVSWIRNDLSSKIIHQLNDDGDDLKKQNKRYKGRTAMEKKALDSGNFSLSLRKPQISDSGNYICTIRNTYRELNLTEVQLQVKDDQKVVELLKSMWFVELPCKTSPPLPEDTRVKWTLLDSESVKNNVIHSYQNKSEDLTTQDCSYCRRTSMNEDLLISGDLSLTILRPREEDCRTYICTFYVKGNTMKQKLVLENKLNISEPQHDPGQNMFLMFLIILVVVIILIVPSISRPSDLPEVEPGKDSTLLSGRGAFKIMPVGRGKVNLLSTSRRQLQWCWKVKYANGVKWIDKDDNIVCKQGCNAPDEPVNPFYEFRVQLNDDFSVTMKYPTDQDSSTYTCILYKDGKKTLRRQVKLKVRVHEVEAEEGAESVQLPFQTICNIPQATEVMWYYYSKSGRKKIFLYKQHPCERHHDYETRAEMTENPLVSGDLTLILKYPTDADSGKYRCEVRLNDTALTKKQVLLKVKGRTQNMEESVVMTTRSSQDLVPVILSEP